MKKLLLIVCLCLCLSACSPQSTFTPNTGALPTGETRISAEPEEGDSRVFSATLYFRFGDTTLLRQETRQLTINPNESREKALVNALLEGSQLPGSVPLFPEGTQVLSTQMQQDVIYITFNEALYSDYSALADENLLRRHLAMAALTATLTESGDGRAVQVLVRSEQSMDTSMRLRGDFLDAKSDIPLPPLRRDGAYLPTPAAYARAFLSAWQQRDYATAALFLSLRNGAVPQNASQQLFDAANILTDFELHEASIALDGGSAVLSLDLTLLSNTTEFVTQGYPLRLVREDGAWKISMEEAAALMEVQHD